MEATQSIRTETLQLAEMQVRELIQTPIEARFNRIARLTQRALGSGVAAISFINLEGEWFKAVTGWNVSALPRTQSLAALLMHGEAPVAVGDLLEAIADAGEMLLLERALAGAGRYQESVGVCVIDIDDFKLINDRYGHAAGELSAPATESGFTPGQLGLDFLPVGAGPRRSRPAAQAAARGGRSRRPVADEPATAESSAT